MVAEADEFANVDGLGAAAAAAADGDTGEQRVLQIDEVVRKLEEGAKESEVDSLAMYCIDRLAHSSLYLAMVIQAQTTVHKDPQAASDLLQELRILLDDDNKEIASTFPSESVNMEDVARMKQELLAWAKATRTVQAENAAKSVPTASLAPATSTAGKSASRGGTKSKDDGAVSDKRATETSRGTDPAANGDNGNDAQDDNDTEVASSSGDATVGEKLLLPVWVASVSTIQKQLGDIKVDLDHGLKKKYERNLAALPFEGIPELIVSNVIGSFRTGRLQDVVDIARDAFHVYEPLQDVNEKAEAQKTKENQRIPIKATLGSMMKTLNDKLEATDAEHTHPLVKAAIIAVQRLEAPEECDDDELGVPPSGEELMKQVKKVAKMTKLTEAERSIFNSVLNLVASFEALRCIDTVDTDGGMKKGVDRLINNGPHVGRDEDEQKLKVVVRDFLPGTKWEECKVYELTCVLLEFLAQDDVEPQRRICAIDALIIIFGQRLVKDVVIWSLVDKFTLNDGEDGEGDGGDDGEASPDEESREFFANSNQQRYNAVRYSLLFILGKDLTEVFVATDELDFSQGECFQSVVLRCSVDRVRTHITKYAREEQLFNAKTFEKGVIEGNRVQETVTGVEKMLDQSKERNSQGAFVGFRGERVVLYDLDMVVENSMKGIVALTNRTS